MLPRSGWICCENTLLVSHAGCIEASHSEQACACLRRVAPCFARASGLRAATRPSFAALTSRSVAPPIAQLAQWVCSCSIVFPHPRQTFSLLGGGSGFGKDGAPFASRLCCCVNRVARIAEDLRDTPHSDEPLTVVILQHQKFLEMRNAFHAHKTKLAFSSLQARRIYLSF